MVVTAELAKYTNSLIEFQCSIFDRLVDGEDVKEVAGDVRKIISHLYEKSTDRELGISVNDICNLACSHCYYDNTHDKSKEAKESDGNYLSASQWVDVVDQALVYPIRHFSIVGKEPLLPESGVPRTKAILERLEGAKSQFPDITYEMVNNGHFITRNLDWLANLNFGFFSVSFDGDKEAHNAIRGERAYEKSLEGISRAHSAGIRNLTATYTAMPQNVLSLGQMIKDLSSVGLEYLSIGFCFNTPGNNHSLQASFDSVEKAIDIVRVAPGGLDITLAIQGEDHPELIAEFYRRGHANPRNLAVTEDLSPTLVMPFPTDSGSRAALQVNILPTAFEVGMRIDYDGKFIDFCRDRRAKEKTGFAHFPNHSVRDAMKISREEIWPEYTVKYYTRLQQALRGEKPNELEHWYSSPFVPLNVAN